VVSFFVWVEGGVNFYKRLINILFGIGNLPTFAPRWQRRLVARSCSVRRCL
jgi:hypothetical protein